MLDESWNGHISALEMNQHQYRQVPSRSLGYRAHFFKRLRAEAAHHQTKTVTDKKGATPLTGSVGLNHWCPGSCTKSVDQGEDLSPTQVADWDLCSLLWKEGPYRCSTRHPVGLGTAPKWGIGLTLCGHP